MGKRVKRNRRVPPKSKGAVATQSPKDKPQEKSASTIENVDDGVTVEKEKKTCPHFDKGINLDNLLTKLRSSEPVRCLDCREGGNDRRGNKGKGKHGKKKGSASVDSKSESKAVWVCLECGHYVCAGVGLPTASTAHAVRHLRQTRHHLVIQWDNPQLRWCFSCKIFIPVEKTEENGESKDVLDEVVKLIREHSSKPSVDDVENIWFGSSSVTSATKSEGTILNSLGGNCRYVVRGLDNLGNTCYFNSVMQNLLALDRLRDHFLNLDASMGQLTICFKKLFAETKPERGLKISINPRALLGSLYTKAPQFRGYQQHDSHELLRCLLDGLYMEELTWKKQINASPSDEVVSKEDLTFVDAVFGGQISSTLRCEECGHFSTVYEPFLDLSLSVPTKKTPSKKAQPVTQAKKKKQPPKKVVRPRGKVSKDADQAPAQGVTTTLSSSESTGLGHRSLPQTKTMVASSSDSLLPSAVGPSTETIGTASALQNFPDVAESQNEQVMENMMKENAEGAGDFAWMDYLETDNTLQENAADDFIWMDYLQQGSISNENDMVTQNNDISCFQDSGDNNLVLNEDLAGSRQISLLEVGPNKKPNDYGNLEEEELPLLVQGSEILLLPYKEESTNTEESVRENEASSSNACNVLDEVDFDGFGDIFNEPEITAAGPSLPNEVSETGILSGNVSDSDPDEIDDSDSPVSVESCLVHFIKPELLFDDNAWNCENCVKIVKRQKLNAKKKQNKRSNNLINGGETQSHYESPSLNKESPCPNGVRNINNCNTSTSGESFVLRSEITDSLNQNNVKVENGQTGEINSVVYNCEEGISEPEDATLIKSKSSVFSESCGKEQSGAIQHVDSVNVENRRGNDKFLQINSEIAENCQSGESDDEEVASENIEVKRNATKRVLIYEAPSILTIHLKRFSQDARGRISKLNGHVNFSETINLRPYMDPRCEDKDNCIYQLMGVVQHSGTMRGGHYTAYVRGGEKRKEKSETEYGSYLWYYVSDHSVHQVPLEKVLSCEAYILFYEKI